MIEEGFYLLRQAPLSTHAAYVAGTAPFLAAVVVFTVEMARSPFAAPRLGLWSFALAVLYLWMKVWQSAYASLLYRELSPASGDGAGMALDYPFRRAGALLGIHLFSVPAHLVAAVLTAPIGWTVAFFQAASVAAFLPGVAGGDRARPGWRSLVARSAKLSTHRPLQNHGVLIVVFAFWVVVWLSLTSLFGVVPMVLKLFTGIETIFTRNPVAALGNSTTQAVTLSLSFLAVGPLLKAVSVLRCFYALAETTGDDLRARMRSAAQNRAGAGVAVALAVSVAVGMAPGNGWAAEETGTREAAGAAVEQSAADGGGGEAVEGPGVTVDPLAGELESVLRQREFRWRIPKPVEEQVADGESGGFAGLLKDWAGSLGKALDYAFESWNNWRREVFGDGGGSPAGPSRGLFGRAAEMTALQWVLYGAGLLAIALLVVYAVRALRSTTAGAGSGGVGAAAPPIDLEAESVQADALEQDAWVELAQAKVAAGEYRLAVRAFFLACLSNLADRRFLRLRRTKSNRDYGRELALKGRDKPALTEAFASGTATFERTWYGDHPATTREVEAMRENYERIQGRRAAGDGGEAGTAVTGCAGGEGVQA